MIDPVLGAQLATGLVGSVAGAYAVLYVWEFAKRLLR